MENMATLYGVNPENDVEVQIRADYPSQVVYILVTAENAASKNSSFSIQKSCK